MSQLHPHPGMYAWDESDSRSIASHTSSYGSTRFQAPPAPAAPAPRASGFAPSRLAASVIARIRSRGAAPAECSQQS